MVSVKICLGLFNSVNTATQTQQILQQWSDMWLSFPQMPTLYSDTKHVMEDYYSWWTGCQSKVFDMYEIKDKVILVAKTA